MININTCYKYIDKNKSSLIVLKTVTEYSLNKLKFLEDMGLQKPNLEQQFDITEYMFYIHEYRDLSSYKLIKETKMRISDSSIPESDIINFISNLKEIDYSSLAKLLLLIDVTEQGVYSDKEHPEIRAFYEQEFN